jgi:hypothetical protein
MELEKDESLTYSNPAPRREQREAFVPDFDVDDVPPLE